MQNVKDEDEETVMMGGGDRENDSGTEKIKKGQGKRTQIAKDINSTLDFGQTSYFWLRLKNLC